jgi:DNA-binding transcriptional regulator YhcF (GntR family)
VYKEPFVLTIDLSSDVPAYRQIVDSIRHALVEGQVAAGTQLPPVRQLAADLGVHFNTVAESYRILADEGWLDLKRGRGAVVVGRQLPGEAPQERLDVLSRRLRELIAEFRAGGVAPKQIAGELRTIAKGLES